MRTFVWVLVIIGAIVGGITFIAGMLFSKSAPQEAASAAAGIAFVVIPYCFARAFCEIWDQK